MDHTAITSIIPMSYWFIYLISHEHDISPLIVTIYPMVHIFTSYHMVCPPPIHLISQGMSPLVTSYPMDDGMSPTGNINGYCKAKHFYM